MTFSLNNDHLSVALEAIEYYEEKVIYYDFRPNGPDLLEILSKIKQEIKKAIREQENE